MFSMGNVDRINLNKVVLCLFLEIAQKHFSYIFFGLAFFVNSSKKFCFKFKLDFLKLDFIQDVPDLEGDKTFGIRTFTVHLGQKRVCSVHSSSSCGCPTGYYLFYLIILFSLTDLGRCSGLVFLYWKWLILLQF